MKKLAIVTLAIVLMHIGFTHTSAQTTIFNAPSTDVTSKGKLYVEADFAAHLDKYSNGGFQTYAFRSTYGAAKNLEVGANVFYTRNGSTSPVEIQPNFKWQAYSNEKHGVAVSTGGVLFIPVNDSAGDRPTGMVYSNISKEIKGAKGLRLTGGGYAMVGAKRIVGTRGGVVLGLEKPVAKRVTFIADWFSGKNRVGYSAAGFSVAVTKKQTLFAGYNFGNSGRGNNGIAVFYGYSF